jgi:CubicO group peptidase (beta-lactamase class C family)
MRFAAAVAAAILLRILAAAAEPDTQRIDRIFAAYAKPDSPGCALGVIHDGSFVYRKGYGFGSLEFGVPLSSGSVFYMGSVSKQFTAASIVLAAEQGFLTLDDNVRRYIPELPDYGHPITLRQMLHHTSGFRDVLGLMDLSGRNAEDLHSKEELIDLVARQKALNYNPGDEYLYSNTNYLLLAEVINRATKKRFSEFAAENIFRPLGMTHTRFYDDHTVVVPGRVAAYRPGDGGGFLVDWSTNFDQVGGGGLMSTVDDLLLWDRNFYENRLGKGTLLKEMQTRGVLNNGKQIGYALGLDIGAYRGLPVVEHDGALFGYRTAILRFPGERFTVVCLCNLSSTYPGGLARQVADVYLEKKLEPVHSPAAAAAVDPAPFAGKYLDRREHSVVTFTVSGGNLVGWGTALRSVGPNRFEHPSGGTVTFDNANGGMQASAEENGTVFFNGEKIEPVSFTGAALAAYAGTYKSAELDATYKLSVENAGLILRNGWNSPQKLEPIVPGEFEGGNLGTLVFERDASGRVSGLSVFAGRIRDLRFQKVN